VVLAPGLDHGVVDEHVDEFPLEGVRDREELVVDRDHPVGADPSEHPLSPVVLGLIDRDRGLVLRDRSQA